MIFIGMDAKAVHCVEPLSSNAVLAGKKLHDWTMKRAVFFRTLPRRVKPLHTSSYF